MLSYSISCHKQSRSISCSSPMLASKIYGKIILLIAFTTQVLPNFSCLSNAANIPSLLPTTDPFYLYNGQGYNYFGPGPAPNPSAPIEVTQNTAVVPSPTGPQVKKTVQSTHPVGEAHPNHPFHGFGPYNPYFGFNPFFGYPGFGHHGLFKRSADAEAEAGADADADADADPFYPYGFGGVFPGYGPYGYAHHPFGPYGLHHPYHGHGYGIDRLRAGFQDN